MTRVIRFNTSAFDVTKERPNPINPIPGKSLLLWLRDRARPDVEVSEPAFEGVSVDPECASPGESDGV